MTIQDYITWLEHEQARENISAICLREKHREIAKEISYMLKDRVQKGGNKNNDY